ncbi:hypothetical protein DIS24_g2520 [Lasiodiplodia hormozganensis]|uniref:Heterokaryon incompatibility domain-containing protein n=1 Tax=Lasiodiplodia hormozganensis TaxID=869390 RepID=A0AA40D5U1_9PEZI|nr:hypothetical protein DIS24_g2520 [Lasiodiplodia hormozganensis]
MDHLPTFASATGPYPTVPYLPSDDDVYDGDTFEDYPERQRWSSSLLFAGDFRQGRDLNETAVFLQKWLYFGLVSELSLVGSIFGCKISLPEKFVQEKEEKKSEDMEEGPKNVDGEGSSGGGKVVSTKKLEKLLKRRVDCLKLNVDNQREEHLLALDKALATACAVSEVLAALRHVRPDECPLPFEIILSIKVLGRAIDDALRDGGLAEGKRDWGLRPIAVARMRNDGWCPREISLVNTFLSEASMFCASYMKRESTGGKGAADHSRCNDFECQVNQINNNDYKTRHYTEDCNCQFYHVDEEKLKQVIRHKRIPYIEMKPVKLEDETKTLQVELQSQKGSVLEFSTSIVIFSHVWSDGLGNPKNNALPKCQLQRFYNILRDAPWWDVKAKEWHEKANRDRYKERQIKNAWTFHPKSIRAPVREFLGRPVCIWLDTLCVPVEGGWHKTEAIQNLKRYYANADITVVLDAELLRVEHEKCSEGEILLRIALSGWMRRCWTYQEAIIASGRLRVLFADGYYDLPDVVGFMRQLNSIAPYLMSQEQQKNAKDIKEAMTYSFTAIGTAYDIYCGALLTNNLQKTLSKAFGIPDTINLGPYINKAKGIFNPKDPFTFLPAPARLAADTKSFFAGITAMWAEQPTAVEEQLQNRVYRMVAAWESLRYRTTSRSRDRLVNFIFACAKEQRDFVALEKVLREEETKCRFRTWLLKQPALPAGLLFVQGPKMKEHGFRWAPTDVHFTSVEDDALACCVGWSVEEKRTDVDTQPRFQTPGMLPVAKDVFSWAKESIAEYMKEGGEVTDAGPRTPALSMTVEGSLKLQKPGFLIMTRLKPADVQFYLCDIEAEEKSYRVVLDWTSTPPDVTAQCLADVGPSFALVLRREPENGSIETAALLKDVVGAEKVYNMYSLYQTLIL